MGRLHRETHLFERIGWLRAAVLGANDGIISTASLILGVAAAAATKSDILLAGIAGLVAGAMSMAAGEYVSGIATLLVQTEGNNGIEEVGYYRRYARRAYRRGYYGYGYPHYGYRPYGYSGYGYRPYGYYGTRHQHICRTQLGLGLLASTRGAVDHLKARHCADALYSDLVGRWT